MSARQVFWLIPFCQTPSHEVARSGRVSVRIAVDYISPQWRTTTGLTAAGTAAESHGFPFYSDPLSGMHLGMLSHSFSPEMDLTPLRRRKIIKF